MKVIYTSPRPNEQADKELGAKRVGLDELLAISDFVSVHTSLNDQTRGMFGAKQFAAMKRSAVFVNTARGGVVDQTALGEALKSGTIFAAGLDVTEPEPLPADHPLYQLANVLIAPHVASATHDTRNAMARICAENLLAGVKGEKLRSWVNPEVEGKRR
jgi:glyoxylate reductase